ncbi:SPL family radical SAM protein [Methanobrevibacter olleyae]|uniref:DNA repair photolyase n=1 Tax=Methanobrevibacter olleyae TaxID=294671 RepID=A0A126R005_METOL|nr:radical SAM protein [Methanobrevibacter olleyae]AMK15700.1 radical SAM domain-containing protein [Methanobrevibacter olleyae]SFL22758.1 DNA repair photolyase [Methanobrevibacter olleyae]
MHYVNSKSILSNKNGMNLYRGCSHGCIYCDSRSKVYNMNHDFEDIEIKANAIELLKKALKSKREKIMIGTGAMTDPYIPIEEELNHLRQSLELIYKYGHGFTCITKSDLILRDLDLLKKINKKSKVVVQMTLTTYDEDLCKVLEPNVSSTKERVKVLEQLNKSNIPTVVWLCPILPFINDTEENINGIIDYCIETNVEGIICFGIGMTLREGNREYFYKNLDKSFPALKEKYIETYGNSYILNSPNNKKLMEMFYKRTKENNIMNNPNEIFEYLNELPNKDNTKQTTFF